MNRDGNGKLSERGTGRARWVNEYRISGLSLKQFAERHGLSAGQLRYWIYGPSKPLGGEGAVPVFQEVRLAAAAAMPAPWIAEVGLSNGTTVRLARETDVTWAMALIDSLRRPCS